MSHLINLYEKVAELRKVTVDKVQGTAIKVDELKQLAKIEGDKVENSPKDFDRYDSSLKKDAFIGAQNFDLNGNGELSLEELIYMSSQSEDKLPVGTISRYEIKSSSSEYFIPNLRTLVKENSDQKYLSDMAKYYSDMKKFIDYKDKEAGIDRPELKRHLTSLAFAFARLADPKVFEKIDVDRNGHLDNEEIEKLRTAFKPDSDRNEYLSTFAHALNINDINAIAGEPVNVIVELTKLTEGGKNRDASELTKGCEKSKQDLENSNLRLKQFREFLKGLGSPEQSKKLDINNDGQIEYGELPQSVVQLISENGFSTLLNSSYNNGQGIRDVDSLIDAVASNIERNDKKIKEYSGRIATLNELASHLTKTTNGIINKEILAKLITSDGRVSYVVGTSFDNLKSIPPAPTKK